MNARASTGLQIGRTLLPLAVCAAMLISSSGFAQLQITEVMFNPLDANSWEWVEIRNLDPNQEFDLDGSYLARLNSSGLLPGTNANVRSSVANNTKIPAGGIAILYNGEAPGIPSLADSDGIFFDAWNQADPNTVVLIAAERFPAFNGLDPSSRSIGIWPDFPSYQADLVGGGSGTVGGFSNSQVSLDYRTNFPTPSPGSSIFWNGQGSQGDGVNWTTTTVGNLSSFHSVPAFSGSGNLNSTDDLANPGRVPNTPSGGTPTDLIITEMMIDPMSPEPDWEWIEVYNAGADLTFDPNNAYFLDDDEGADLTHGNIKSGSIPADGIAVLFNADALTIQNMKDAWDPNDIGTNFIPVTDFPDLDNDQDSIAIWTNFSDYQNDSDAFPGEDRDVFLAETSLFYSDFDFSWPIPNTGRESIYLSDLNLDQDDGFSWSRSDPNVFGDPNSFFAQSVSTGSLVHGGGDLGSPGSFDPNAPLNDTDFDEDGLVTGLDFLVWQRGLGGSDPNLGDTNKDQLVDSADLAVWESQYPQVTADFNLDGQVDGLDFLAWQRGEALFELSVWESLYGSTPSVSSVSAVPEPSSLYILLTLFFTLGHCRNLRMPL